MKRTLAACVAGMTCSAAIVLGAAQAPSSAQKPDESITTVTGCVQPGDTAERFVLASTAVVPNLKPNDVPDLQPGAGVPAGVTTKVVRYELIAAGSFDLAKLVGHRVEAKGRVSLRAGLAPSPSIPDAGSEEPALIHFRAGTVRDLAPMC
jgi:hypothetical protein